jgi:hypothetical protein
VKCITTGIGSCFNALLNDSIYKINNATDAAKCNTKNYMIIIFI